MPFLPIHQNSVMFSRPGDLNSENSQGLGQEHA